MSARIKLRRDTAANWKTNNPILAAGETGIETDTKRIKFGDGSTNWVDLSYGIAGDLTVDATTIKTEMGLTIKTQDPETWAALIGTNKDVYSRSLATVYDSKGNIIVAGERGYDDQNDASFVVKYTSKGEEVWKKEFNYGDGDVFGGAVDVDSNDNIIIGISKDDNYAALGVIRLLADTGEIDLNVKINDIDNYQTINSLRVDANNDIVLLAGTSADTDWNTAILVAKIKGITDPQHDVGDILWQKVVGSYYHSDFPGDLTIDNDNNIIVVGYIQDDDVDLPSLAVLKLNGLSGVVTDKKRINSRIQSWWYPDSGIKLTYGYAVAVDGDNNIYLAGSIYYPNLGPDGITKGILIKLNSNFEIQWSRTATGSDYYLVFEGIIIDNGVAYITGESANNVFGGHMTSNILCLAVDINTGVELWQNAFGRTQQSESGQNEWNNYNGRFISSHDNLLSICGSTYSTSLWGDWYGPGYYGNLNAFVLQVDKNGKQQDIPNWTYSKATFRFDYENNFYVSDATLDVNDANMSTSNGEVVMIDSPLQDLISHASANTWDFSPDGNLTLPEDSDLKIQSSNVGWATIVGLEYNQYDNINAESVVSDDMGNSYLLGFTDWNAGEVPLIVKLDPNGIPLWQTGIRLHDMNDDGQYYDNINGSAESAAFDPTTGDLVVGICDGSEGYDQIGVCRIDPENGKLKSSTRYRVENSDIQLCDVAVTDAGVPVVVGYIDSSFKQFPVTKVSGGSEVLVVQASMFGSGAKPNYNDGIDWFITGTDINGSGDYLGPVNYYPDTVSTVRQGSGAKFDITYSGNNYSATVTDGFGGTNYRVGHNIKVLGTQVGGLDGTNDVFISVAAVDGSGMITDLAVTGTAVDGSGNYSAVGGINHLTGAGATFAIIVDSGTGAYSIDTYNQVGSNYVAGDQITILGTALGGSSPTNDITINVDSIGLVGDVYSTTITSSTTGNTNVIKFIINNGVDYSQNGVWTIKLPDGGDGFVLTPAWQKAIGSTSSNEYAASVTILNNHIYVGGSLYYAGTNNNVAYIARFTTTGTLDWIKSVNGSNSYYHTWDQYVTCIDSTSEGDLIIAHSANDSHSLISKLDVNTGNVKWQKRLYGSNGAAGVAVDIEDNILVTQIAIDNNNYSNVNDIRTTKLDRYGNPIWQRRFGSDYTEGQYLTNGMRVVSVSGTNYFIAAHTYAQADNYTNGVIAKFPIDGTGTGTFGHKKTSPGSDNPVWDGTEGGSTDFWHYSESFDGTEGNGNDVAAETLAVSFVNTSTQIIEGTQNPDGVKLVAWDEELQWFNYGIVSQDTGGIEFSDGTRQTTSAVDLVQTKVFYKDYNIKLSDRGRHILVTDSDTTLYLDEGPIGADSTAYNMAERGDFVVNFPIGSTITIVNISGGSIYLTSRSGWVYINGSNQDDYIQGNDGWDWEIQDSGSGNVVTLLKVTQERGSSGWMIIGSGINTY